MQEDTMLPSTARWKIDDAQRGALTAHLHGKNLLTEKL
jgi:hypothetical protein